MCGICSVMSRAWRKKGRDCVWRCGAPRSQNSIPSDSHTADSQDARKIRNVARPNLKEERRIIGRNLIFPPLLFIFQSIFVNLASIGAVGDDLDRAYPGLLNKLTRRVVQFDLFDAQFSRTQGARNERDHNYEDNKG